MKVTIAYGENILEVMLDPNGEYDEDQYDMLVDSCGYIPEWFAIESNNGGILSPKEVIETYYPHGGGWRPFGNWKIHEDDSIEYPGDPIMHPIMSFEFSKSIVFIYNYGITRIGTEVARLD